MPWNIVLLLLFALLGSSYSSPTTTTVATTPLPTTTTTRAPIVTTPPATLPPVVTTQATVPPTPVPVVTTPPATHPPVVTTPATIATNLGPSCAKKLGIVRNRDVVSPECHRKLIGKSDSHSIIQGLFQTLLSEDSSKHYDYKFCSTTFMPRSIPDESFADIRDMCGTPERDRVLNIFYEMRKCLTCEQLGYPLVINLNFSLG